MRARKSPPTGGSTGLEGGREAGSLRKPPEASARAQIAARMALSVSLGRSAALALGRDRGTVKWMRSHSLPLRGRSPFRTWPLVAVFACSCSGISTGDLDPGYNVPILGGQQGHGRGKDSFSGVRLPFPEESEVCTLTRFPAQPTQEYHPLFPALRSGLGRHSAAKTPPTAVSGASRQKQIPNSRDVSQKTSRQRRGAAGIVKRPGGKMPQPRFRSPPGWRSGSRSGGGRRWLWRHRGGSSRRCRRACLGRRGVLRRSATRSRRVVRRPG